MIYLRLLFALTFILSAASCSQKNIQLNTVLNSNQCGLAQQKSIVINSEAQLRMLFPPKTFNYPLKNLPSINFDRSSLILLSMGRQPTSGYSIHLNSSIATIVNDSIKINAAFTKPPKGYMTAQILTSPCALYQIEKSPIQHVTMTQ